MGVAECAKTNDFENWHFEPFKNCLFLHFASQSWTYSRNVQMHRVDIRESSLSCKALARDSWNSLPEIFKKWKFLKNFTIGNHSRRQSRFPVVKWPKQSFSILKIWHFEKNFKDQSGKNQFQKHMKYSKIFLNLIIKQLSIHKSHLNMYNHTNEIGIHWTLDLCVVCKNQVWISP